MAATVEVHSSSVGPYPAVKTLEEAFLEIQRSKQRNEEMVYSGGDDDGADRIIDSNTNTRGYSSSRILRSKSLPVANLDDQSIQSIQFGRAGSLRQRFLLLKNQKGLLSPLHDLPLHLGSGELNFVCLTPRGCWLEVEMADDEPYNPLRIRGRSGLPSHYTENCKSWHYGFLPQTWVDPDEFDTDLADTGLPFRGGPLEVVVFGDKAMATGTIQPVKILGAYAIADVKKRMSWKLLAVVANEPKFSSLSSLVEIQEKLPGVLDQVQRWLLAAYGDWEDDGQFSHTMLNHAKTVGQQRALRVMAESHASWQLYYSSQPARALRNKRIARAKTAEDLERLWAAHLETTSDISIPVCEPDAEGQAILERAWLDATYKEMWHMPSRNNSVPSGADMAAILEAGEANPGKGASHRGLRRFMQSIRRMMSICSKTSSTGKLAESVESVGRVCRDRCSLDMSRSSVASSFDLCSMTSSSSGCDRSREDVDSNDSPRGTAGGSASRNRGARKPPLGSSQPFPFSGKSQQHLKDGRGHSHGGEKRQIKFMVVKSVDASRGSSRLSDLDEMIPPPVKLDRSMSGPLAGALLRATELPVGNRLNSRRPTPLETAVSLSSASTSSQDVSATPTTRESSIVGLSQYHRGSSSNVRKTVQLTAGRRSQLVHQQHENGFPRTKSGPLDLFDDPGLEGRRAVTPSSASGHTKRFPGAGGLEGASPSGRQRSHALLGSRGARVLNRELSLDSKLTLTQICGSPDGEASVIYRVAHSEATTPRDLSGTNSNALRKPFPSTNFTITKGLSERLKEERHSVDVVSVAS